MKNDTPDIQLNKITHAIMDAVKDHVPPRSHFSRCKKIIPRNRRILFKKRKKALKNLTKDFKKIKKQLLDIEYELNESYRKEEQQNERKAIDKNKQ